MRANWSNSRHQIWFGIWLAIPIMAIVIPMEWLADNGHSLCLWRNLTGHECWACGTTRAVVSVMKLQFTAAWHYNHLIVLSFPVLAWLWFKELRRIIARREPQTNSTE